MGECAKIIVRTFFRDKGGGWRVILGARGSGWGRLTALWGVFVNLGWCLTLKPYCVKMA